MKDKIMTLILTNPDGEVEEENELDVDPKTREIPVKGEKNQSYLETDFGQTNTITVEDGMFLIEKNIILCKILKFEICCNFFEKIFRKIVLKKSGKGISFYHFLKFSKIWVITFLKR